MKKGMNKMKNMINIITKALAAIAITIIMTILQYGFSYLLLPCALKAAINQNQPLHGYYAI